MSIEPEDCCPNCGEEVGDIELMMHDGYCKVCYDDGVGEDEDDEN